MWAEYVRRVTRGTEDEPPRQAEIAKTLGSVHQTTVSRWLSGAVTPDAPADVAHFARTYGRNVLEAFVAAGMLTVEEAGRGLTMKERTMLVELGSIDPVVNHQAARRRRRPPPEEEE